MAACCLPDFHVRLTITAVFCALLSAAGSITSLVLSFNQIKPVFEAASDSGTTVVVEYDQGNLDRYCSQPLSRLVAPFQLVVELQTDTGLSSSATVTCPWQPANTALRVAVDFILLLFVPCLCFLVLKRQGTSSPMLWCMKAPLRVLLMAAFASFAIDAQMSRIGHEACRTSWDDQLSELHWNPVARPPWTVTATGCSVDRFALTTLVTFVHTMVLSLLYSVIQRAASGFDGTDLATKNLADSGVPNRIMGQQRPPEFESAIENEI